MFYRFVVQTFERKAVSSVDIVLFLTRFVNKVYVVYVFYIISMSLNVSVADRI